MARPRQAYLPSKMTSAERQRVALVTGITGQDGSYLAELLLEKGYTVHGSCQDSHLVRLSTSVKRNMCLAHRYQTSCVDVQPNSYRRPYRHSPFGVEKPENPLRYVCPLPCVPPQG
jgi:hypothetical protein